MKYEVQYARIEHQVYFLEIEADSEDHACSLAKKQFTGKGDYELVTAEQYILQVNEIKEVTP